MFYIKLNDEMDLVITVREAIHRGDHLNQKLTFLVPQQVGDIEIASAALYLSYIRADGTADIDLLHREKELYNDTYYQFTMPVTSKLTRFAGPVTIFLTIYAGPANAPMVVKSGECMLHVQASTNMDELVTDQGLSLLYSIQKEMEDKITQVSEELTTRMDDADTALSDRMDSADDALAAQIVDGDTALGTRIDDASDALRSEMNSSLAGKADGLSYNGNNGRLQLTSGGTKIGNHVIVPPKNNP